MNTFFAPSRKAPPGFDHPPFEAIPLISVLLSYFIRPKRSPAPHNPDWERDEPMTGLS